MRAGVPYGPGTPADARFPCGHRCRGESRHGTEECVRHVDPCRQLTLLFRHEP